MGLGFPTIVAWFASAMAKRPYISPWVGLVATAKGVYFWCLSGHETLGPSYLNLEDLVGTYCQESIGAGSFSSRETEGLEGLMQQVVHPWRELVSVFNCSFNSPLHHLFSSNLI